MVDKDQHECHAVFIEAYDTRFDMSHTTCWIRQNLRMSDRVSPPKAYDRRSDMSYTILLDDV